MCWRASTNRINGLVASYRLDTLALDFIMFFSKPVASWFVRVHKNNKFAATRGLFWAVWRKMENNQSKMFRVFILRVGVLTCWRRVHRTGVVVQVVLTAANTPCKTVIKCRYTVYHVHVPTLKFVFLKFGRSPGALAVIIACNSH